MNVFPGGFSFIVDQIALLSKMRSSNANLIFQFFVFVSSGRKEWPVQSTGEGIGKPSISRPHVGGLFPAPDVQPLW